MGIVNVTITGDPFGSSFVMDDLSYTTSVPEPSSIRLLATVLLILFRFYKLFCKST